MADTFNANLALSIEQNQRIDLNADGTAIRGYETYIREYVGMIESGLMARMSNAAYKTLHALALRARILGDPRRRGAEEEYQELARLGIVSNEDKGHLFCFPSREQLLCDTGIGSVNTIDAAVDELAELKIVKRITPAQPRRRSGLFGSNVYIIHPESFIGKFGTGNGDQKLIPVESTEISLRDTVNRALKNKDLTTTTTLIEPPKISHLVEFFADAIGAEKYAATEKETRLLATLLMEGFSAEQIESGITRAVEHARERKRTANLSYCARFVRHVEPQDREIASEDRKSSGEIVTGNGKSSAQIVPVEEAPLALLADLELDDAARLEMANLIALLEEHSGQKMSKALVRRWLALRGEFQELAMQQNVTPLTLIRQAVEEALDAGSAHKGFCAPKMARVILTRWMKEIQRESNKKARGAKREIPPAVRVFQQVHRRFPAKAAWETIAQAVGTEESALAFWRETLTAWAARGYNPLNVEGPLEWFRRREIPKNGYRAPNPSEAAPTRPVETLEVIQERLRLNALEQQARAEASEKETDAGEIR